MYGPVSKNGPALEFGEIGEEVKDEVRIKVRRRTRGADSGRHLRHKRK